MSRKDGKRCPKIKFEKVDEVSTEKGWKKGVQKGWEELSRKDTKR